MPRIWLISASASLAAVIGLYSCARPGSEVAVSLVTTSSSTSSSTTTSTTSSTTTTTTVPDGPPAPLTGVRTTAEQAFEIASRSAVAVKIDNSPEAMPQAGINDADVVIEIKVEGISRLMAVFHSRNADTVGPVRSARSSDPAILAALSSPTFGFSGANDGVLRHVASSPWINDASWDRAPGAYHRQSSRPAPHNLFTSTTALSAHQRDGQTAPIPIFLYSQGDETNPSAQAASRAALSVGSTSSQWNWKGGRWLRSQYGRAHRTSGDQRVWADNVVVIETRYTAGRYPAAWTIGGGRAAVFSNGTVTEGQWTRPTPSDPFQLATPDGSPILLTPGRTWIELPASWDIRT